MNQRVAIIGSCILGLALGYSPIFNHTVPIFLKPMVEEFGWSRTQVASGVSISLLVQGVCAMVFGQMQDRIGPRRLIIGGCILFPAALMMLKFLPGNYLLFCLIAGLIGAFGTGTCPLAYLSLLPRWFDRRLGTALGLANSGIGIGFVITPLVAQWLLVHFGWRDGYAALALFTIVITLPNALLLREAPQHGAAGATERPDLSQGMAWSEVWRTQRFWGMVLVFFLLIVIANGCSVHLAAIATDRGLSPGAGALAVSVLGMAVLAGRFVMGLLLDAAPVALVTSGVCLGGTLGAGLLFMGAAGPTLFAAAALIGFAQGAEGDLLAYVVRRTFGMRNFGAVFGRIFMAFTFGAFSGPLVMGLSYDHLKSYTPMLGAFIVMGLIASAIALTFRPMGWVSPLPAPARS